MVEHTATREDLLFSWIVRNPFRFVSYALAVLSGIPFIIGVGLGAWIF